MNINPINNKIDKETIKINLQNIVTMKKKFMTLYQSANEFKKYDHINDKLIYNNTINKEICQSLIEMYYQLEKLQNEFINYETIHHN